MKTTAVSKNFVGWNFEKFLKHLQFGTASLQFDWMMDRSIDCSRVPPGQHQFESAFGVLYLFFSDYTVLKGYKPSQNVVWPEYYSYEWFKTKFPDLTWVIYSDSFLWINYWSIKQNEIRCFFSNQLKIEVQIETKFKRCSMMHAGTITWRIKIASYQNLH